MLSKVLLKCAVGSAWGAGLAAITCGGIGIYRLWERLFEMYPGNMLRMAVAALVTCLVVMIAFGIIAFIADELNL